MTSEPPPSIKPLDEESAKSLSLFMPAYAFPSSVSPISSQRHGIKLLPHLTLTYACSLDGCISLAPGVQTQLSGAESKMMTHHLRLHHDAILVGAGTARADDPGLYARTDGATLEDQPIPLIVTTDIDVATSECKLDSVASQSLGKKPIYIVPESLKPQVTNSAPATHDFLFIKSTIDDSGSQKMPWEDIMAALATAGIRSVMVEGGASVLGELMMKENQHLISSVIVTVAPIYLGQGALHVSSPRPLDAGCVFQFDDIVKWIQFGQDVVMCAKTGGKTTTENERDSEVRLVRPP